jgi:hypothetical protein
MGEFLQLLGSRDRGLDQEGASRFAVGTGKLWQGFELTWLVLFLGIWVCMGRMLIAMADEMKGMLDIVQGLGNCSGSCSFSEQPYTIVFTTLKVVFRIIYKVLFSQPMKSWHNSV